MMADVLFWSIFALAVGTGMWGAIKQHGHTSATDGGTLSLSASSLADGAVTAAKLASDAVTTAKILDANVTAAKLKTATGVTSSGAGARLDMTLNAKSFAPSITNTASNRPIESQNAADPGNAICRFSVAGSGGGDYTTVRWEYMTSTDDPTVWIAYDPATGEIRAVWASDDPTRNDEPGVKVPGCLSKKFKAADFAALGIGQGDQDAAAAMIAAEGLKTKHLLYRALQLREGDHPAAWLRDNCKIKLANGSLIKNA
jgi:hypothetical protein